MSRWAGLLAVLPVALDAYVLDIEQFLLAEGLFLFLLAVVVVALLARERPGGLVLGGVGVLAGVLSLTRTTDLAVAGVVLLHLLVRLLLRTLRWTAVAGFVLGLAAPLLRTRPGSTASTAPSRSPTTPATSSTAGSRSSSGATRSTCRPGCGQCPPGEPAWTEHDLEQFARAAIEAQPGDYATRVLDETAHYFSPGRSSGPQDACPLWWQFPVPTATAPSTCIAVLAPGPHAWRPALVAACVPTKPSSTRPDRSSRSAPSPALLVVLGLSLLLVPAATASFDWRYLLPALVVLPPAAALALRGSFGRDRRPRAAP